MITYEYKNYKVKQIKVNNQIKINVYDHDNLLFSSFSKRILERKEVIKFVKSLISKIYLESES